MAYQSWSVVFGEQPTASKWNILGSNDASFNDGTGIGTNAIAAASLATSAIKLGLTSKTSDFSTSSTTAVQVTGLSVTVTIPAGGRSILIMAVAPGLYNTTDNARAEMSIWDGVVASGTRLQYAWGGDNESYDANSAVAVAVVTPSAGSKTYNVGLLAANTGTATMPASATGPSLILVMAI